VRTRGQASVLGGVFAAHPGEFVRAVETALEAQVRHRRDVVRTGEGEECAAAVGRVGGPRHDHRVGRARWDANRAGNVETLCGLGVAGGRIAATVDRALLGIDAPAVVAVGHVAHHRMAAGANEDAVAPVATGRIAVDPVAQPGAGLITYVDVIAVGVGRVQHNYVVQREAFERNTSATV